jgi:peptidoglycan DL-endopeptidase LytE
MKNRWKTMLMGAAFSAVLVAPTVDAATYTVQKGDTLTKIAKAHSTTIQQLKQWNSLTGDQIYINQKLTVSSIINEAKPVTVTPVASSKPGQTVTVTPAPTQTKPTTTEQVKITYTVVKGDNLTKIAAKYGVKVADLKQWNTLKSDAIFVGQKLTIETKTTSTTSPNKEVTVPDTSASTGTSKAPVETNTQNSVDEAIAKQLASEVEITVLASAALKTKYEQVIVIANSSLGIPYKYGGSTIDGFDCSGFVSFVYNTVGIELPRKSSLMYFEQDTTKVKSPEIGDVVFFKNTNIATISHMGIYIGNDEFIHASTTGVAIANLKTKYWSERFVAFKRFNGLQ